MSIINSGSFAKALWPGVNAWYGKSYNDYPVEFLDLFEKNSSTKAFEEDIGVSSFGLAVQKGEGAPIQYDTERQGFITRYQHVVFALGFIITREVMEDDQYDVVGQKKANALARSIRQTKEIFGANVYNRAFNAAFTGGDGVSMINAAHPNIKGQTSLLRQPTCRKLQLNKRVLTLLVLLTMLVCSLQPVQNRLLSPVNKSMKPSVSWVRMVVLAPITTT
jgi:hypothetical protein